jgi:hypothetical protein
MLNMKDNYLQGNNTFGKVAKTLGYLKWGVESWVGCGQMVGSRDSKEDGEIEGVPAKRLSLLGLRKRCSIPSDWLNGCGT